MKVTIKASPKEIADLLTEMSKGQPELTIDGKTVAKAVQKAIHGTAVKDR